VCVCVTNSCGFAVCQVYCVDLEVNIFCTFEGYTFAVTME
jgi:hypothetical protein